MAQNARKMTILSHFLATNKPFSDLVGPKLDQMDPFSVPNYNIIAFYGTRRSVLTLKILNCIRKHMSASKIMPKSQIWRFSRIMSTPGALCVP